MASEIKDVKNIKFSLEKQKGLYSGQAISGMLSTTPEGYGKAIFKTGETLEGRFKNGNFVSGKATTKDGTLFEGEFDNMKLLSGTVTYPNGDFLVGKINPKTLKLELEKFRVTQNFGDVVEGTSEIKDGAQIFNATQTSIDDSVFTGIFEKCDANDSHNEFEKEIVKSTAFGVVRPVFECKSAKVNLTIFKNINCLANFVGDFENGTLKGVYTESRNSFQKTLNGTFEFSRKSSNEQKNNSVSDDFCNFFELHEQNSPVSYNLNMTKGDIMVTEGSENFKATKLVQENGDVMYHGTFSLAKNKQTLTGDFFSDLSIKQAKANFETTSGKIIGTFEQNNSNYNFVGELSFFNGDFKKGKFKSELVFEKTENGILRQVLSKNIFESGTLKQTTKQPNETQKVFEGKTRDLITKDEGSKFSITSKPSIFENQNKKIAYIGKVVGTLGGEQVMDKTGLFDASFELLEGHIEEHFAQNDDILWVIGDKKFNEQKEERFIGRTGFEYSENFFQGEFLPDYTFLKGNLEITLPNRATFTGTTNDVEHFKGKLERKNYFWQEGDFVASDEKILEFVKGKTLVYFDRPDDAKCFAHFDKNGYKDFGGKTHICIITTKKIRPVVDMFATDSITDAMTQFDRKINNEKIAISANHQKVQNLVSSVNTTKTAEQKSAEIKNVVENTEQKEQKNQSQQFGFREA